MLKMGPSSLIDAEDERYRDPPLPRLAVGRHNIMVFAIPIWIDGGLRSICVAFTRRRAYDSTTRLLRQVVDNLRVA